MSQLSRYWKTVMAVLAAVVVIGNQCASTILDLYGDKDWSSTDTITAASVILGALLVYQKANTAPPGQPPNPDESVVGPGNH